MNRFVSCRFVQVSCRRPASIYKMTNLTAAGAFLSSNRTRFPTVFVQSNTTTISTRVLMTVVLTFRWCFSSNLACRVENVSCAELCLWSVTGCFDLERDSLNCSSSRLPTSVTSSEVPHDNKAVRSRASRRAFLRNRGSLVLWIICVLISSSSFVNPQSAAFGFSQR